MTTPAAEGWPARAGAALLPLVPGVLTVVLSFQAGGFFPDATAIAAIALIALLVVRVTLAPRPLAGAGAGFLVGLALLVGLAAWSLASSAWSGAPGRAILEYDRVLLYLLAFALFGAAGCTPGRLRWLVRGLAAGITVVVACALVTRVAPDVWMVELTVSAERLSYPLTYWNALGLLAALGLVLCFAITSDSGEVPAGRVLAAAALPILAASLLLTLSRGAMVAGLLGVIAVVVVGRPRALLSGLLVAVPAIAIPVISAHGADLLATERPTTQAAADQGHDVALVVALCMLVAAAARFVLLRLDTRLDRLRAPAFLHRRGWRAGLGASVLVAGTVTALALGAPDALQRQYDRFVDGDRIDESGGARLTNPGNNGRLDHWDVALQAFREQRIHGQGAGVYALEWDRRRPEVYQVEDAHSLYMEVLAELGLVGLPLVAGAIVLMLVGLFRRARGPDRVAWAALFAAVLAWAAHAGVDWDWEMPAVTLWVFAAGGMALARSAGSGRQPSALARVIVALGLMFVALTPVQVLRSERSLNDSRDAFAARDCPAAIDRALDSIEMLGVRAEPFVILGYCNVRVGQPRLAVRALENAVSRDPSNWEVHYGLALVRGASGEDPRSAAREARRLNPGEPLAAAAVRGFDTEDRQTWRRRALQAPLPTD